MSPSDEAAILGLAVRSLHQAIRRMAARILEAPEALGVTHFRQVEPPGRAHDGVEPRRCDQRVEQLLGPERHDPEALPEFRFRVGLRSGLGERRGR